MSSIAAGTTTTTGYVVTSDSTGALVLKTGSSATTAVTIDTSQNVTFVGSQTLSGGTANGVLYLNGSKAAISGSALTFDGTNFASTGSLTGSTLKTTRASGAQPEVVLTQTSVASWSIYNPPSSTDLRFYNGSDLLTLASSGNLGIGTSSPAAKLDVRGNFVVSDGTNGNVKAYVDSNKGYVQSLNQAQNAYRPLNLMGSTVGFENGAGNTLSFDSSGNLGLGVTPSAWSGMKAFQLGDGVFAMSSDGAGSGDGSLTWNGYYNGTNWIYGYTGGGSSRYRQNESGHAWFYAASGTAGNTITFTQAMTLDASGRLGIGTTSPSEKLHLEGSGSQYMRVKTTTTNADMYFGITSSSVGYVGTGGSDPLAFYTAGTERARIDSSGNVGIGTSSPVAKLQIKGSGTSGQVTASFILENSSSGTAGMDITGSAGASRLRFLYGGGPSTGTNALTEAMCLLTEGTSAGNVGIGTTNPTAGFANHKTTSQLSSGSTNASGVWTITNTSVASNNATIDVLRLLNTNGTVLNNYISGHVYIAATGASGGNGFSAIYELNTTSNGTVDSSFTLETSVTRGTNPISSVAIANDGGGGAIKVQVTWINNAGVVTGGACNASFVGFAS